jgi:hypothetical protein
MQPITAEQISGMLNIQPVAGTSDMMLSLEECTPVPQDYNDDRVRLNLQSQNFYRNL